MQAPSYPPNVGPLATLSPEEKKKRLDAMVRIWQSDTERRCQSDDIQSLASILGLDEYRYSVSLRFPEWERSAVVGQVVTLRSSTPQTNQAQEEAKPTPILFSQWRTEPLLRGMPDWKKHLPDENVFNLSIRITPGGLGEGSKWAIVMPRDMVPRYRPGWPTQQEWVAWTRSFDWLSVAVGFIRAMLDEMQPDH
jgi:hypothetical protein